MPISDLTPGRILRSSGPSFRDAIETARGAGFTSKDFSFRIVAERWFFLRGQEVSLIGLELQLVPTCFVWLSSSPTIYARDTIGSRQAHPAHVFNNAIGDHDGNVTLEDGTHLYACEVEHFGFPKWGPKENHVVSVAVIFMQTQGKHLRTLDHRDLEGPNFLEMFKATGSTNLYVDYGALPSMEDEKLDAFLLFYEKEVPQGERLSRQTIACILSDAGMRIVQRKRAA